MADLENATKKLTRAEACIELARRIWPHIRIEPSPFYADDFLVYKDPDRPYLYEQFNPFTDRDVTAEIVEWFARNDEAVEAQVTFVNALCRSVEFNAHNTSMQDLMALLCATPEQITLAACAALGIEVEE